MRYLMKLRSVDQHLKEYDAEIENTLQKIQYTEAKRAEQQWSKDIDVYETAGNVGNTLSAYEDYMKAAQLYMDGKTDINAVERVSKSFMTILLRFIKRLEIALKIQPMRKKGRYIL